MAKITIIATTVYFHFLCFILLPCLSRNYRYHRIHNFSFFPHCIVLNRKQEIFYNFLYIKKSLYTRKLYRDFIFKHRILYQKIHTEKNVFMSFPSHRGSLPSKRCVSVSVQQVSWLEITFLFPFPYHLMQYSGSGSGHMNPLIHFYSSFSGERVILLTVAGAAAASHCIPFSIYPARSDNSSFGISLTIHVKTICEQYLLTYCHAGLLIDH